MRRPGARARSTLALVSMAALVGACATAPTGPRVTVMPGSGKSLEAFQQDVAACQQYAQAALGSASQSANDRAAGTAVAGSAIGAATGAIVGSPSNQGGQGAAIGAGIGLLYGAIAAANVSNAATWEMQRQYDGAYMQCMYAHGNQVPVRMSSRPMQGAPAGPGMYPPPNTPPPYPPPNTPPPSLSPNAPVPYAAPYAPPYPAPNSPPPYPPPNTPPPPQVQ
jgi:hypothetical protein